MSLQGFRPVRRRSSANALSDSWAPLRLLFILGALPAAAIALLAPEAIALPAASFVSILLAMTVAIYAWRKRVNYASQGLTFWDLAGMLAFIGFGAGALSEPTAALELFGMNTTR